MGKKSREKRERKRDGGGTGLEALLRALQALGSQDGRSEDDSQLNEQRRATREYLSRFNRDDALLALNVSDLWPANVASGVKHLLAFGLLLGLEPAGEMVEPISTYAQFSEFIEALYATWPEFPSLEDFSPEADWGQIRVRLGADFVPMFYGSSLERTPDFVEAFRITYAQTSQALADMDLAIAIQARLIEATPEMRHGEIPQSQRAHVETPPESFWVSCRQALLDIGGRVLPWRAETDGALETRLAGFTPPASVQAFGDATMRGMALPLLAVETERGWIPVSVRSGPGVVIDHWAEKRLRGVGSQTHRALAWFVAERFLGTAIGPMSPVVGEFAYDDLAISCIVSSGSLVYLICAIDHSTHERVARASKALYARLRRDQNLMFRHADGRELLLSRDGKESPTADEVRVVMVVTQSTTSLGSIEMPDRPARIVPLGDFVTILDSLDEMSDLESFWNFVDSERAKLSPFSTGPADLFASFKDSYGVLVDGATSPDLIMLDPHWGTSWRYKQLLSFWLRAPRKFPDGSSGWRLGDSTSGVIALESRHQKVMAYSTTVGSCIVQPLILVHPDDGEVDDGRMIDMFMQLLADGLHRCANLILDAPIFTLEQLVITCEPRARASIRDKPPEALDNFPEIVASAVADSRRKGRLKLKVETRAILAGLSAATDGSFEIRCLVETLRVCHMAYGMEMPVDLPERLASKASETARYQLKVADRQVDVPDYLNPIVPSPTEYKLARKRLAMEVKELGLQPGRYELAEAKAKIDSAAVRMRRHLERQLASFDSRQLLQACIEQNDALLAAERMRVQRARQSLSHAVEYDRLDAVEQARKDFGNTSRNYRYLLEKVASSPIVSGLVVQDDDLRKLVGLVDWYMVLTSASDVLHNGIDVGGVEIDDSFIPTVFYSREWDSREEAYAREHSKNRLGIGLVPNDAVEGSPDSATSDQVRTAFVSDLGFGLEHLLSALAVLSQAQACGLGDRLALSYSASAERIAQSFVESIEGLKKPEADKIVEFLTLSGPGILRLAGRDADEPDVPYWEHTKRLHRYSIRPLVVDRDQLRWGAETASRAFNIWTSSVRDGYLPADFDWGSVVQVVREIKQGIEKRLELRSEEIFRRHTKFVVRGVDFRKRFGSEGFDDVGDYDVLAYWPDDDLLVAVECKYNQPPHTLKDSRRLRDRIFGRSEDDRDGQFSRILRRREFLTIHRARMIELLKWPAPKCHRDRYVELYVCRDVYYWMVHPPYKVPTEFMRIDGVDTWIKEELPKRTSEQTRNTF